MRENLQRVRGYYAETPRSFDIDAYLEGRAAFPSFLARKLPEVFGGIEWGLEKPARPIVLLNFGYWAEARGLQDAQVALVHTVARRVPNLQGATVLDVGSGYSGPAILLAQEYGARVDCVNIVAEQVRKARLLIERNGVSDRVRCHIANAMDLPFPDASFDVVFCLEAAHNFADKPRFLCEARRVLCPGGTLMLADVTATTTHLLGPWLPALGVRLIRARDWRALLLAAGLRIIHVELMGRYVAPGIHGLRGHAIPWRRGLHAAVANALNAERHWPGRLSRLARLAHAVAEVLMYMALRSFLRPRRAWGYTLFVARKPWRG